jgi:hypothetical protein
VYPDGDSNAYLSPLDNTHSPSDNHHANIHHTDYAHDHLNTLRYPGGAG